MKSQTAIEFMSIVALGLTLIAITSFFGVDYITSYFRDIDSINAQQTVDTISSSINLVYAQGAGAVTKAYINLPNGIDRSGTYLYKDEINLRLSGKHSKDVYKTTKIRVYGAIPLNPGRVTLSVEMVQPIGAAVVFVNDHNPSGVFVEVYNDSSRTMVDNTFSGGDTVYYTITLSDENFNLRRGDSPVNMTIYYPNKTIAESYVANVHDYYLNNYTLPSINGTWIISAMIPDSRIVGAAYIKVG